MPAVPLNVPPTRPLIVKVGQLANTQVGWTVHEAVAPVPATQVLVALPTYPALHPTFTTVPVTPLYVPRTEFATTRALQLTALQVILPPFQTPPAIQV